jgi:alpha/beta superfamily hydrolase
MYDFSFLKNCRKPVLFVHGERDEFGDVAKLQALAAELPAEAHARVQIIPAAGHFFDNQLEELSRVIREWVEETIK